MPTIRDEHRRPQTVVGYARAGTAGASPLVDEAGPGYVVPRLPPPPVRLKVFRLLPMLVVMGAVAVVWLAV